MNHTATLPCCVVKSCSGKFPSLAMLSRTHRLLSRTQWLLRQLSRTLGSLSDSMRAWQVTEYGGPLHLASRPMPLVTAPDDVVVRVRASSINPIDVRMIEGYGKNTLNAIRKVQARGNWTSEFPLVMGKDFSGEVVSVGRSVRKLRPGDEVWGVVNPITESGTHADFTVTKPGMILKKPLHLSHIQAASFPYIAMTAWSTVAIAAAMPHKKGPSGRTRSHGKRVLILGGSGGMGTFTIQLLRDWGAEVVVVCSAEGKELVSSLGVDDVLDYRSPTLKRDLQALEMFDVIIDYVSNDTYDWTSCVLRKKVGAKFVKLNFPFLSNQDTLGVPLGLAKSVLDLSLRALPMLADGSFYRWSMFVPNLEVLRITDNMTKSGKMVPVISKILPFSQTPMAYEETALGRNKGKIVINHDSVD